MAKLLKKIWKASTGAFFETQLEAVTAERQVLMQEVIKAATESCLKDKIEAYKLAKEAYDKACDDYNRRESIYSDRRGLSHPGPAPEDPMKYYRVPHGFVKALTDELTKAGLLVPPQLEAEDE